MEMGLVTSLKFSGAPATCNFSPTATEDDGTVSTERVTAWRAPFGTWSREVVLWPTSDTDFDGCVSMTDLLDLLSVFGTCEETSWSCGDPLEYQGYDYETVQIVGQCWFAGLACHPVLGRLRYSGGVESNAWEIRPHQHDMKFRGAWMDWNRVNIRECSTMVSASGMSAVFVPGLDRS